MFNFHKPRTYRSAEGCCICRAKSSSSRFADSRKYERDSMQCFDLKYPRQGEICNACVLLVKRYKRLPVGSKRNWSHVVDARMGPGCSKTQSKIKSERTAASSRVSSTNTANSTAASGSSCQNTIAAATNTGSGGMSFIPEKFSKIFKKSKKSKDNICSTSLLHSSSKRKITNNGWSNGNVATAAAGTPAFAPDSLDSDYEDSRLHGSSVGQGSQVQFQTQTRASAYRAQAALEARKRILKLGSKRRKSLKPRKNRRVLSYEESIPFFDVDGGEWQEQKSCCGMFYECPSLAGALILDFNNYKPCDLHRNTNQKLKTDEELSSRTGGAVTFIHVQKQHLQTVPAVVQLQPPASANSVSLSYSSSSSSFSPSAVDIAKSNTPVLKKHHLFFKRQSECFPQGDMISAVALNETHSQHNTSCSSTNATLGKIKTECDLLSNKCTMLQQRNENAIQTNSSTSALSISISPAAIPGSSSAAASSMSNMPQMPKHSLAKITTISPPPISVIAQTQHNAASHMTIAKHNPNFLHKIKDTAGGGGKVLKNSLEKFNTSTAAVRQLLKSSDLQDMKPIIKTVDKSYVLSKPSMQTQLNALNSTTATYQTLAAYNASATSQPLTTASLSAASPTSSTSSTSSTKFSDNSSDSGFDENTLDRKSASPLQEDCEKKLLSRPGVQTMFLASGVQIQGQPQNLVLTGNEVAAKILQNRKYSSISTSSSLPITSNNRTLTTTNAATTAVKIAQIPTTLHHQHPHHHHPQHHASNSVTGNLSTAAQAKMRAIYNNNNTIQHENGITTIVPASSLAATTQTAAMQQHAAAPSTVTITPAPPPPITGIAAQPQHHSAYNSNSSNIISRKLTTNASIINLQSNTNTSLSSTSSSSSQAASLSNANNGNHHIHQHQHHQQQHHHHHQQHLTTTSTNNLNQKIILLKTSPNMATSTKYNTLHQHTATSAATNAQQLQHR